MELTDVLDGPCCKIRCVTRGVGNGITLPRFLRKQGASGGVASQLRETKSRPSDRAPTPKEWRTALLHMDAVIREGLEAASGGQVKLFTGDFSGIGEFKAGGWRIMFFLDLPAADAVDGRYKDTIIITTCFIKDRPQTPREEKDRCLRLRTQYHTEKYGTSK